MVLNKDGQYEPIEPNKTYTLASHNYLLQEGGSGCPMFMDNVFLMEEGMADYQVLITYMQEGLNGKSMQDTHRQKVVLRLPHSENWMKKSFLQFHH